MDNLILCSQILYNNDIQNKSKEIKELKKFTKPKIDYENLNEWKNTIKKSFKIIKDGIHNFFEENNDILYMHFEYRINKIVFSIREYIIKAILLITKNTHKEWVELISDNIIFGISSFLSSLTRSPIWNNILDILDIEILKKIIYDCIKIQLEEDPSFILESIALFTCKKCNIKDDYITSENLCIDCGVPE